MKRITEDPAIQVLVQAFPIMWEELSIVLMHCHPVTCAPMETR